MTPKEVLGIANHPDVPKFNFDSRELEEWNREHRCQFTGTCFKHSGLYVVNHRSFNPRLQPDFQVLSSWVPGAKLPYSWDVPPSGPFERIESVVVMRLLELGWRRLDETAIAEKTYQTAAGEKAALVYLTDWRKSFALLSGHYWSEGRNILDPIVVTLAYETEPGAIRLRVDRFVSDLDKAVGESYAVKLLRPTNTRDVSCPT